MKKAMLEPRHAVCMLIMYMIGSTVVIGVSTEAKQDAWMSILIATAYAAPILFMYARIMKLYPEKDLYEIAESVAGKVAGKVIIVLFTWYALHLGALVLRNFVEFTQMNVLRETPRIAVMIVILSAVIYLVKSGVQTIGKLAVLCLFLLIIVVIITVLGSINQMETYYMLPVLSTKWGVMLKDGYNIFTFPYAETVLFLTTAGAVRKQDNAYKIYLWSVLAAAAILIVIVVRNILILGPAMASASYFPSFVAARIINIGDFFARIEGSISMNFIMSGIIKISVCLFAATTGIAKLAGITDYKRVVFPVTLLMMALCEIVYKNLMEMFAWLSTYRMYAIPFQLILPAFLWIVGEIKTAKAKKRGLSTN
jgi:spore germination protein KB